MRVCFVALSLKVSFLFTLLACCQLVAHPVGEEIDALVSSWAKVKYSDQSKLIETPS